MKEVEISNLELYQDPSGEVLIKPLGRPAFLLDQSRRDFIVPFKLILSCDYAQAWRACEEWNHKSRHNTPYFDFLNIRRFCKCNFQKYDGVLDIDENGNFHYEFTDCPMRGECKFENVLCNAEFTTKLTPYDLEITRLIVLEQMTAEEIAFRLDRSVNTINNRRKTILKKTGCSTIASLTNYWHQHNLR